MATNGAPGSAPNNNSTPTSPLTLDQTTSQLVHIPTASSSDNRPDTTPADQTTIRDYFERHMTPAVLPRSLGKTSVWANLPERVAFQMTQPAKVVEIQNLIDNLSNDLPRASVDGLKTIFSTIMAMNDTAAPRLVKLLEDNLAIQLELHTNRQQEVLDLHQKLDAQTRELDARIHDFDARTRDFDAQIREFANKFDYTIQKKATSIVFAVVAEQLDDIINDLDSKLETRARATVAKVTDEDISGRTQKIVDCLQKQCEDIAKEYDTKSTAMEQLMDRLKTQQSSLASEIDKIRTDNSNHVVNNSSDFKELQSTVQKHDREMASKSSAATDDDIKRINDNIQRVNDVMNACCDTLVDHEDALCTISARSKDNRTALRQTITTLALQTQVTSKLEQAAVAERMLDSNGDFDASIEDNLLLQGGQTLTSREIVTTPDTVFTSDICQRIQPTRLEAWGFRRMDNDDR